MSTTKQQRFAELARSPAAFRAVLNLEPGVRFAPDDWQRADFEALDPGWQRVAGRNVEGGFQRAWLERPRGHSKTADLAIMVAWVLAFSPRRLAGVAAAADKDQARLLRDAVAKLVEANPWLSKLLDVQQYRVVNPKTDSTLEILSSDTASSYGLTPDFIIVDEVTHWGKRDLWDSLLSSAAKRARCMLLVICNAGFQASWQWDTREAVRSDPDWCFSRLDGPCASWISPKHLAEQRRLLPSIAYDRLWLNRWSAGAGDAISDADVRAALTQPGPLLGPERGWVYVAGLDLGLKRDASALVVLGRHVGHYEAAKPRPRPALVGTLAAMVDLGIVESSLDRFSDPPPVFVQGTGRLRVAAVHIWQPNGGTVSVEEIEQTILQEHERFRFAAVAFDPWQAQYLAERLRGQGVHTEGIDFVPANLKGMAAATLEAFSERQIDLYQHERLLADVRGLRVEERLYGVRLTSPRGPHGHGDSATALSIGLLAAKRFAYTTARINRPLLCWP